MRQPIELDDYFLALCDVAAQRSKDPSTQVGAVLVKHGDVLSTGYNGMPAGMIETPELWSRPTKYGIVVHAEENVILRAARNGVSIKGATLYLSFFCCSKCARLIGNSGVGELVYNKTRTLAHPSPEVFDFPLARRILSETGVAVRGHVPEYELSITYQYSDEVPL